VALPDRKEHGNNKKKVIFLKKVLCVSGCTSLCLVYILAKEPFFIGDLRYQLHLCLQTPLKNCY
jgi:hypothetical protein